MGRLDTNFATDSCLRRADAATNSSKQKRNFGTDEALSGVRNMNMAEGEGFEPPEGLTPQRFSRPPQSTALPPLQVPVRGLL